MANLSFSLPPLLPTPSAAVSLVAGLGGDASPFLGSAVPDSLLPPSVPAAQVVISRQTGLSVPSIDGIPDSFLGANCTAGGGALRPPTRSTSRPGRRSRSRRGRQQHRPPSSGEPLARTKSVSYANAVRGNSSVRNRGDHQPLGGKGFTLNFFQPAIHDGRILVVPPDGITVDECSVWANTLVGHFIGKKLNFHAVKSIAFRIWGELGLQDVLAMDNGFFFFQFLTGEAVITVLDGGPWHMVKMPLVLKRWSPNLTLLREDLSSVPLWTRLYGIPLEYWFEEGLSYIASAIGKPLYTDRMTSLKTRISYARLCVEVGATSDLIKEFDVQGNDGNLFTVFVTYDWTPDLYSFYNCFGHSSSGCAKGKSSRKGNEVLVFTPPVDKAGCSKQDSEGGTPQDVWHVVFGRRPPLILSAITFLPWPRMLSFLFP